MCDLAVELMFTVIDSEFINVTVGHVLTYEQTLLREKIQFIRLKSVRVFSLVS